MKPETLTPKELAAATLFYARLLVESEFRELTPDEVLFLIVFGTQRKISRELREEKEKY